MKFRTLGSTGLKVSVVGVGTWQFGGEWGRDYTQGDVNEIFDAAREADINLLDTAECYGDHLSERLTGEAIRRDRERWVVATKFGHKFHEPFIRDKTFAPQAVRQQLEDSLRALQTDYVDLYQFHSGTDEEFATEGMWEMLNKLKDEGKVRHLGISIGMNTYIEQTDQAGDVGAEAIQVVYNRLNRKPEEKVFASCQRQNLGVLARVPLASGYLSGKYAPGATFADNDVRGKWHDPQETLGYLKEVERIAKEELPAGVPMARWALAWCLQHPAVTCVIPGCKNAEQVHENAAAADLEMVRADHPQAV